MYVGKTLFAQLMDLLPWTTFARIVTRYGGDHRVRTLPCTEHFRVMAFAQLTYRESLRDIEACLSAQAAKLYHMGLRGPVARSTLAEANEGRDWRLYATFAQALIAQARKLYAGEPFGAELEGTAYALDTTNIELCLSLFPWAEFKRTKGAVRLHTQLDLRGNIPTFIHIDDGKSFDSDILDAIVPEAGAIYVMDRGFIDFGRLNRLAQAAAFFVVRSKTSVKWRRILSRPVDNSIGIEADQIIRLVARKSRERYPDRLRRVSYRDADTGKRLVFLTNNLTLPARTIADLYKCRWQIELFFKWIKQNLSIKSFFGTSQNAVRTQIWIAVSVYVLIAILKKRLKLDASLSQILQTISITLFEKMPLDQLLGNIQATDEKCHDVNQLKLQLD